MDSSSQFALNKQSVQLNLCHPSDTLMFAPESIAHALDILLELTKEQRPARAFEPYSVCAALTVHPEALNEQLKKLSHPCAYTVLSNNAYSE